MTDAATQAASGSNSEILASAYQALAAGDVPAVFALLADEITWHISGRNVLSADYAGHDEVLGFFRALGERSNGTFTLEVREIIGADSGTAVALVPEHATRDDSVLDDESVHVWRFENGKATSFRCFAGDEHAQDAFWS